MSESPPPKTQQPIPASVSPQITSPQLKSPTKTDIEVKKQRKKKQKALKEFLTVKQESDIIQLSRKPEQQPPASSEPTNCKICGDLSQKKKQCQFCKDTVCLQHIRKKRKHKATGKFARICDDCEDHYIGEKHNKLQGKAEEAMIMQEMIVQAKHDELAELVAAKQTKIAVMHAKKRELEEVKKQYHHKLRIAENDIGNKEKRFELKLADLRAMEQQVVKLEESLPRPLDDDYNCLVDQNSKINKELVKYEKMCSEALKAKSTREKQLYEAYYKWEKKESVKTTVGKKEECAVY